MYGAKLDLVGMAQRAKNMKLSDLKDGYFITLAIGEKYYVCDKYGFHMHYEDPLFLSKYNDDLTFKGKTDQVGLLDIVKVEYMGDLLWVKNI